MLNLLPIHGCLPLQEGGEENEQWAMAMSYGGDTRTKVAAGLSPSAACNCNEIYGGGSSTGRLAGDIRHELRWSGAGGRPVPIAIILAFSRRGWMPSSILPHTAVAVAVAVDGRPLPPFPIE